MIPHLSDSIKTWPLAFARHWAQPGSRPVQCPKKVGGLPSWSIQLDSPGTALTVGGWIRPRGKTSGIRRGLFSHNPFSKKQCSLEASTGMYLVLTLA